MVTIDNDFLEGRGELQDSRKNWPRLEEKNLQKFGVGADIFSVLRRYSSARLCIFECGCLDWVDTDGHCIRNSCFCSARKRPPGARIMSIVDEHWGVRFCSAEGASVPDFASSSVVAWIGWTPTDTASAIRASVLFVNGPPVLALCRSWTSIGVCASVSAHSNEFLVASIVFAIPFHHGVLSKKNFASMCMQECGFVLLVVCIS